MARRSFDVVDITEILVHWYAGRSQYQIAESLAVDRKTIRKYLRPALEQGLAPGGPPISEAEWAAKVRAWFPEVADLRLRQVTWKHIEPHHAYIKQQLEAGVSLATVHQRLRDEHGLAASVASLRRYVQANLPAEIKAEQVRVLNPHPYVPGEQAQIDWGRLGTWIDPRTGKRHTLQAFVMVLCCSRHMFMRPVARMTQTEWTRCHVEAFGFFGGVPARLVPDNLKTGVDKPDLYDPKLNRSYAELAAFYGTLIDPARAGKPRDKAQVERPIPYVRDSFWKGRDFSGLTLEQVQAAAVAWCAEVAGRRACRPLDGAQPIAVFAALEAPALRPLPPGVFEPAEWSTVTVHPDIHVKVGKTLYSIPWKHIGKTLHARVAGGRVQFFDTSGELVKTHLFKMSGRQRDDSDHPPGKIAFFQRTPAWCRRRAREVGPACTALINELLAENALYRLRAAQGVLGLGGKYDDARLEAACHKALAVGDPTYKTVKGILAAGTETDPVPPGTGDAGAGAFLHGPAHLFAVDDSPGDSHDDNPGHAHGDGHDHGPGDSPDQGHAPDERQAAS
jgi:transposase